MTDQDLKNRSVRLFKAYNNRRKMSASKNPDLFYAFNNFATAVDGLRHNYLRFKTEPDKYRSKLTDSIEKSDSEFKFLQDAVDRSFKRR